MSGLGRRLFGDRGRAMAVNFQACEAQVADLHQEAVRLESDLAVCQKRMLAARAANRAPGPPSASTNIVPYNANAAAKRLEAARNEEHKLEQECGALRAQLAGVQKKIAGTHARCVQSERLSRKSELMEGRATRAGFKTNIAAQREQRRRERLETAMQRQQYKMAKVDLHKARVNAGMRPAGSTLVTGGAIAAVAAAFLLL